MTEPVSAIANPASLASSATNVFPTTSGLTPRAVRPVTVTLSARRARNAAQVVSARAVRMSRADAVSDAAKTSTTRKPVAWTVHLATPWFKMLSTTTEQNCPN